jgi:hypothetical protein
MLKESQGQSRDLNRILPDTASVELQKWWEKILATAKEICNDPHGKLICSDVLLAYPDENKVEDAEKGRDCMRRAIEQNLQSMPKITGDVFMQIIEAFKNKREA